MLDRAIPAYRAKLGGEIPNVVGGKPSPRGGLTRFAARSIPAFSSGPASRPLPPRSMQRRHGGPHRPFQVGRTRRGRSVFAFSRMRASRLAERKYDLGIAALLEVGKSRFEAIGEAEEALDIIPFYAEEMRRNDGYHRGLALRRAGRIDQHPAEADRRLRDRRPVQLPDRCADQHDRLSADDREYCASTSRATAPALPPRSLFAASLRPACHPARSI